LDSGLDLTLIFYSENKEESIKRLRKFLESDKIIDIIDFYIKGYIKKNKMSKNYISTILYKKILEKIPICCVDAVVYHNKRFLLIRRKTEPNKGKWWIAGGRVFKKESLKKSIIRKVYEEIGLKAKIEKKLGVYETIFKKGPFSDLKTGVHTINICFLVFLPKSFKINLDKHHYDFQWVNYESIKNNKNIHSYIRQVIEESYISIS